MRIAFAFAFITWTAFAAPTVPAKPSPETKRLMDVARVWITADYFHPYLGYRDIDWDNALVSALPKIRSAQGAQELADAVNAMLSGVHDPLTFASYGSLKPQPGPEPTQPQRSRFHHGLPPEDGNSKDFFTGFLTTAGPSALRTAVVEMEQKVSVQIRLSEPAANNFTVSTERKRTYLDDDYPPPEGRILGFFRTWGAIRYFFAYKDLIDEDWDAVAAEYLPKVIAAKDALEYHLTLAELISHLADSNAVLDSPVIERYFGSASPGVRVRLIEKKPVITAATDAAQGLGARTGNLITAVDGENIVERIKREANYLSASTPAGLGDQVSRRLLNGPADSPARLTMTRSGESPSSIELPRSATDPMHERPDGAPVRMLPGNIAYVDLDRLDAETEDFYQKTNTAKAIIFDFRGQCRIDPQLILRLFPKGAGRQASIVTGPVASEPDLPASGVETSTASYFRIMTVPHIVSQGPAYGGKIVVLIDERTQGKSEQAILQLSAATHVEIVGTPSAGAPSVATGLRLPGRLRLSFSGQDVRLSNGGQLQRQGIQPSLNVAVTLAGLRAGRDEPLVKAIQALNEELPVIK